MAVAALIADGNPETFIQICGCHAVTFTACSVANFFGPCISSDLPRLLTQYKTPLLWHLALREVSQPDTRLREFANGNHFD